MPTPSIIPWPDPAEVRRLRSGSYKALLAAVKCDKKTFELLQRAVRRVAVPHFDMNLSRDGMRQALRWNDIVSRITQELPKMTEYADGWPIRILIEVTFFREKHYAIYKRREVPNRHRTPSTPKAPDREIMRSRLRETKYIGSAPPKKFRLLPRQLPTHEARSLTPGSSSSATLITNVASQCPAAHSARKVACFKCGYLPTGNDSHTPILRAFLLRLGKPLIVFEHIGIIDDFHFRVVCQWPPSARAEFFRSLDGKALSHLDSFKVIRLFDKVPDILQDGSNDSAGSSIAKQRRMPACDMTNVSRPENSPSASSSRTKLAATLPACESCIYAPKSDISIRSGVTAFLDFCSMLELAPVFDEVGICKDGDLAVLRTMSEVERDAFFADIPGLRLTEMQRFAVKLGFRNWKVPAAE